MNKIKNYLLYKNGQISLFIVEDAKKLSSVEFANGRASLTSKNDLCDVSYIRKNTSLLKKAVKQFDEYFSGKRKSFSLPLLISATPFQQKVWQALLTIPYAQTRTYGQIAKQIGFPSAARAIGNANNKNKFAIIIPCHRVVPSSGGFGGYGGGSKIKEILLKLEKGFNVK